MKSDFLPLITKAVFESNVPAARMPERNTSVFSRLEEMFSIAYGTMVFSIVGEPYEEKIMEDETLQKTCIRFVCLDAFIHTCRSLDLVLTATGFGIVSTESTAPASKARVDALIDELSIELAKTNEQMVDIMKKVEGWSGTHAASLQIPTLFWRWSDFERLTTLQKTAANFVSARSRAVAADAILRREISVEYMEELLTKERGVAMTNWDNAIMSKCRDFIGHYVSLQEGQKYNTQMLSLMVESLENYPNDYPTYTASRLHATRHAQRYQNKKEDSTFFFM